MKKILNLVLTVVLSAFVFVAPAIADQYNIIDREKNPQLYCLALNIYFEARGEDTLGQYAVADVTLNRVEAAEFPDTVCEVVYQCRRANACQFSWVHQLNNPHDPRLSEREAWHDAQLYAVEIKKWDIMRGITDGATFFHATYSRPSWRNVFEKTKRIGSHLFYRDPSRT